MNKNYAAGRRLEYQVMHEMEEAGYACIRASGSHGFADVCCFPHDPSWPVLAIQCKVIEGDEKHAYMMVKKFKADPPMCPSEHFRQQLIVQVKRGERVIGTV